jgi:putative aldouronate transport system permease protein
MTTTTTNAARTTATPATPDTRRRSEPFTVVSTVCVAVFAVFCIIPFWMILAGSLTAESTLSRRGYSFFPTPFSLEAYQAVFTGPAVLKALGSSVFITVVGTGIAVASTAGLAWVIARGLPRFSAPLAMFSYIPMLFTGGLVPLYILVTQYLHLQDSRFAVILPLAVAPFLVFVAVSFFRGIPPELLDSARVDGAGELRIFFQIVLPLSKPILAVVALFYAVTFWNEWFHALLFLSDPDSYPLQLVLQNLIASISNAAALTPNTGQAAPLYQLRLALTVITILPILFAYPFAQRYFVKGLTLGATKG